MAPPTRRPGPLRRRPRPNPHKEVLENLSPLTKLAVWITGQVGTMGFFLTILLWTAIWLGWNFFAPERMRSARQRPAEF